MLKTNGHVCKPIIINYLTSLQYKKASPTNFKKKNHTKENNLRISKPIRDETAISRSTDAMRSPYASSTTESSFYDNVSVNYHFQNLVGEHETNATYPATLGTRMPKPCFTFSIVGASLPRLSSSSPVTSSQTFPEISII